MDADIDRLTRMFEKIATGSFDITRQLKRGFFFVDSSREKLLEVFDELKDYGYSVEELREGDDEKWVLQVSKIQALDVARLHRRNIAFNELAAYVGVETYDGWDVQKV